MTNRNIVIFVVLLLLQLGQYNAQVCHCPNECECPEDEDAASLVPSRTYKEVVTRTPPCIFGNTFGYFINVTLRTTPSKTYYRVCWNPITESAFYAEHTLTGETSGDDKTYTWDWTRNGENGDEVIYTSRIDLHVSYRYRCKFENDAVLKIDKGHLAPRADFIKDDHESTYFYINAHPQYRSINQCGNWKLLEESIRGRRIYPTQILTGTYGVMNNTYIGRKADASLVTGKLPIPKFSWKVVYNDTHGVAFVTHNDAKSSITRPYEIGFCVRGLRCTNVCHELAWLKVFSPVPMRGITLCLSIADFQAVADLRLNNNLELWR